MMELIKKYKDGIKESEFYDEPTSIPFVELLNDNSIVSFSIRKETIKGTVKNNLNSVRKIDAIEQRKKTQAELSTLRQMKKEYLSKRNASLSDQYMVMLSGLTTKAQEVFWVIYDSTDNIDCNTIAERCHSKVVTVNCAIKELKDSGLVIRVGSKKTGHYEVSGECRKSNKSVESIYANTP